MKINLRVIYFFINWQEDTMVSVSDQENKRQSSLKAIMQYDGETNQPTDGYVSRIGLIALAG